MAMIPLRILGLVCLPASCIASWIPQASRLVPSRSQHPLLRARAPVELMAEDEEEEPSSSLRRGLMTATFGLGLFFLGEAIGDFGLLEDASWLKILPNVSSDLFEVATAPLPPPSPPPSPPPRPPSPAYVPLPTPPPLVEPPVAQVPLQPAAPVPASSQTVSQATAAALLVGAVAVVRTAGMSDTLDDSDEAAESGVKLPPPAVAPEASS